MGSIRRATCPECGGGGRVPVQKAATKSGDDDLKDVVFTVTNMEPCSTCSGSGAIVLDDSPPH